MSLFVQKFGGSSLASLDNIKSIAQKIKKAKQSGHDIVVVASAMGGETDKLVAMGQQLSAGLPSLREIDVLLSTGEQCAVALLAIALNSAGCPAVTLLGSQIKICTDSNYGKAHITDIETDKIWHALRSNKVVVIPGFQGVADNGDITTLGRGGSDTTAVAIAAVLQADECQIYTDVDGVYTADPRVVPRAELLSEVDLSDMLELSSLGAKVLQIRAVELAAKKNVPMRVLSSFGGDTQGTLVCAHSNDNSKKAITGVVTSISEACVTLCGMPNDTQSLAKILHLLSSVNVEVDMLVQNVTRDSMLDISFIVQQENVGLVNSIILPKVAEYGIQALHINEQVAKLSVVGIGLRSDAAVLAKVSAVLGDLRVHAHLMSASEVKVSVIIDENSIEECIKALHSVFELDCVEI